MLSLRTVVSTDAGWLDGWLGAVAASVGYVEIDAAKPASSLLERLSADARTRASIVQRDGEAVGLVIYRIDAPAPGATIVEIVTTPPAFARRGAGMGAVALIEDALRAEGVRTVYAPSPAIHGIATYFWIRLGYRPLMRAEWPCERTGVAWLAREL